MQRRGLVVSLAVTAVVAVVAAVAVAVVARTLRTGTTSGAADAPPIETTLPPGMLAALQRDLGLSEQEAYQRIHLEAWASQTAAALRDELGEDRYAGAWISDGGDQLLVAVTDQDAADLVRAAGAEPELVSRGGGYLDRVIAALDEHAEEIAEATEEIAGSIAGWFVDVSDNTVVVHAPPEAEPLARQFAEAAGELAEAVRIVFTDERPRLFDDLRGGDPYLISEELYPVGTVGVCSVGFGVEWVHAGEKIDGFVTAGHCALNGTAVSDVDGQPLGEFVAASFPGVGTGRPDDWAVVAVYDTWTPQPVVNDYQDGLLPVAGAIEAPVGSSVCRYGTTTGYSCGVIEAFNASVVYPEGTIAGMTRTSACSEPGDSGGAWLAGDQAQGVTSGGSGDCTVGGTTFFQPLNEILVSNGLTLVTTAGDGKAPPPDPGPPPAGDCDEHDYQFPGQLFAPDYVGVEPGGQYYRTVSPGTHRMCLAGPDAAGFYLVLQWWDGEQWQTVAESSGPTGDELFAYDGDAGYYRIGVLSRDEAGGYLVGLSFDRR